MTDQGSSQEGKVALPRSYLSASMCLALVLSIVLGCCDQVSHAMTDTIAWLGLLLARRATAFHPDHDSRRVLMCESVFVDEGNVPLMLHNRSHKP